MMMRLNKKDFRSFKKKNINLITIDGITCSGKSLFAGLLKKALQNNFSNIYILNKDLFLLSRSKRINITKKINKFKINQNVLHYDTLKLRKLINFLLGKSNKKFLILKNLYNRSSGKNNFKLKLIYSKNRLIIFEGLYANNDISFIKEPVFKILIVEKTYTSLSRKIQRIRDKKISIQLVVSEFIKIHLQSFKRYIAKNSFDISFQNINNKFVEVKNGKKRQFNDISIFLKKHMY
jgi:uridine kinase